MKLFIAIAVLVAYAAATDHPTECGILQRLKVKQQWVQAYETTAEREELGLELWQHIFGDHPELVAQFFERVHGDNIVSPEFRAHAARINGGFDMMVSLLSDEATLDAQLTHLGQQHKEMGISAENFDAFRAALMDVVHHRVGRCFDQEAWDLCTKVMSSGIQAHL